MVVILYPYCKNPLFYFWNTLKIFYDNIFRYIATPAFENIHVGSIRIVYYDSFSLLVIYFITLFMYSFLIKTYTSSFYTIARLCCLKYKNNNIFRMNGALSWHFYMKYCSTQLYRKQHRKTSSTHLRYPRWIIITLDSKCSTSLAACHEELIHAVVILESIGIYNAPIKVLTSFLIFSWQNFWQFVPKKRKHIFIDIHLPSM